MDCRVEPAGPEARAVGIATEKGRRITQVPIPPRRPGQSIGERCREVEAAHREAERRARAIDRGGAARTRALAGAVQEEAGEGEDGREGGAEEAVMPSRSYYVQRSCFGTLPVFEVRRRGRQDGESTLVQSFAPQWGAHGGLEEDAIARQRAQALCDRLGKGGIARQRTLHGLGM